MKRKSIAIALALSVMSVLAACGTRGVQAISVDDAKAKALTHAGVSETDVSFVRADYDIDDGRPSYEIEFRQGNVEYDYDIDANTGDIIKAEKDEERVSSAPTSVPVSTQAATSAPVKSQGITVDEAKSKALEHAGLKLADVRFVKAERDRDDGRTVYEIEFYHNRTEYDYEIDATTGAIISFDKDVD